MQELEPFLYSGEVFDDNICPICPKDESIIPAIWAYVESGEYHENVRAVDQALKVTAATLTKVPFDLDYWTKIAQIKYPNGLPKPYSDDPTQWLFHGHPAHSDAPLQVAVARLLGYRWPAEHDSAMELSDNARAWVKKSEALLAHVDGDGIVCIPAVRGEKPAADRLRELLAAAYGPEWSPATQKELLAAAGFSGKTLENWLRDAFFDQHCKLFHQRLSPGTSGMAAATDSRRWSTITRSTDGNWRSSPTRTSGTGSNARRTAWRETRVELRPGSWLLVSCRTSSNSFLRVSRPTTSLCGGSRWSSSRLAGSLT